MLQAISGFHTDEEGHWVADLACGHAQHVRHDPPWQQRPWVTTADGRRAHLGRELECKRCDEAALRVATAVRDECRRAIVEAWEDAGMSGLCAEGRWDRALDELRALDLKPAIETALRGKPSGG